MATDCISFEFISFRELLEMKGKFPTRQERDKSSSRLSQQQEDEDTDVCWVRLFCSHQWESKQHPDPQGSQLRSLQMFVRMMHSIFRLARSLRNDVDSSFATEEVEGVPCSLARHGWLQAATLVGDLFRDQRSKRADESWHQGVDFLDRCYFWYDYACLHQSPRTSLQELEFRWSLENMPTLLRDCTATIALQDEPAEFDRRGWCAFEVACTKAKNTYPNLPPLVLRMKEMGKAFPDDWLDWQSLGLDKVPLQEHVLKQGYAKNAGKLKAAFQDLAIYSTDDSGKRKWQDALIQLGNHLEATFMFATRESNSSNIAGITYNEVPTVEALGRNAFIAFNEAFDRIIYQKIDKSVNIQTLLEEVMIESKLACTNGSDSCFLALQILDFYTPSGYGPAPPRLVDTALQLLLGGQSLVLEPIMEMNPETNELLEVAEITFRFKSDCSGNEVHLFATPIFH